MKINGKKIEGANYEYVVIPRPGGDIVFKATAILDMAEFHSMCPVPTPPKVMLPGGAKRDDVDDARYKSSIAEHGERRYAYIVIKSLEGTEGLEWETVVLTDPNTWLGWPEEMRASGFTNAEINIVQLCVANANSLNQEKLDEARSRFLASLEAATSPA